MSSSIVAFPLWSLACTALLAVTSGMLAWDAPRTRYPYIPALAAISAALVLIAERITQASYLPWANSYFSLYAIVRVGLLVAIGIGLSALPLGEPAQPRVERGARVVRGRSCRRLQRQLRRRMPTDAVTIGGWPLAATDETRHCKLIGTTGTGKTLAMSELLEQALRRGDRAVISDPDGVFADRFFSPARGDRVLNPFHRLSSSWNLTEEIEEPFHADELAQALIPDADGPGREWTGYARTFLVVVVQQLRALGDIPLDEVCRLVLVADVRELVPLLSGTAAQQFIERGNERMFASIRSVAASALRGLEYIQHHRGPPLAVRSWIRSGTGVLFVPYQADQIAGLRSLIAAWIRLAIFRTLSLPPVADESSRRMWFFVDELDALGRIDGLSDALTRLRKFGGRCVLGFQSIAQVATVYGHGPAQTIVENCGTTLLLRCSASDGGGTAGFASRLIGDREVSAPLVTRSTNRAVGGRGGTSTTRSTQRRVELAVLPSELEQLPDRCGYLKLASQPNWIAVELGDRANPRAARR